MVELNESSSNHSTTKIRLSSLMSQEPAKKSKESQEEKAYLIQNEQIVGIEFVCILDSNNNSNNKRDLLETLGTNEASTNLSNNLSNKNVDTVDFIQNNNTNTNPVVEDFTNDININDIHSLNLEITSTLRKNTTSNKTTTTTKQMTSFQKFRKTNFVFKINKFKITCIMDMLNNNENLKEFLEQIQESNNDVDVRFYLRFNWYSFYEIESSKIFNSNNLVVSLSNNNNNNVINKHTGSSSLGELNKNLNSGNLIMPSSTYFQYEHLLLPKIEEFNWHLKDEKFQLEPVPNFAGQNIDLFIEYKNHVKKCVENHYNKFNFKETCRFVLKKFKTITTQCFFDAQPKTNASKLPPNQKTRTFTRTEDDKFVLNVDPIKFLSEFNEMIMKIDGKFYKSKLEQINDTYYCLTCTYKSSSNDTQGEGFNFRILLKIWNKIITKKLNKNTSKNSQNSTSISDDHTHSNNNNNTLNSNSTNSFSSKLIKSAVGLKNAAEQMKPKASLITEELTVNKLIIKLYFTFNHLNFEFSQTLMENLIKEFKLELEKIINQAHVSLLLKEIHETRKWNNFLSLKNELKTTNNDKSSSFNADLKIENLVCPRVCTLQFKLHRLHQTLLKSHDLAPTTTSTSIQQFNQIIQQQQYISVGLKRLRDSLANFKFDDTAIYDDMFVYKTNNEIYMLTLEEIYDQQQLQNGYLSNNTFSSSLMNDDNSSTNTLVDETISSLNRSTKQQQQQSSSSSLSRRSSYLNILDGLAYESNTQNRGSTLLSNTKSHNLSGDNPSNNNSSANILTSAVINTNVVYSQRACPELIRLNVYGLQPPDDEIKKYLSKTLQYELDSYLLIKMCNSIDKNTYKTSSQHPDKIIDDDLVYFKQIRDHFFEYEIALPFVFNFNRVLRENFLYFVKQIFNSNFKSLDPTSHTNFLNNALLTENLIKEQMNSTVPNSKDPSSSVKDEYDELNSLISKGNL
jgi:hypothetical protein